MRRVSLPPDAFFHARPASLTAEAAKGYLSVVMVCVGVHMADAKNAIALMRLPHPHGTPCELFADGPDEEEAAAAMVVALERIFSKQ